MQLETIPTWMLRTLGKEDKKKKSFRKEDKDLEKGEIHHVPTGSSKWTSEKTD